MNNSQEKITQALEYLPKGCQRLWHDNEQAMLLAPGSKSKHQAWPGGYVDHLAETLRLADDLYQKLNNRRTLPFTIDSVYLVLFLHDLEKPFKYSSINHNSPVPVSLAKNNPTVFKRYICRHYKIKLTEDEENALKYIHGEGEDYCQQRTMGRLAAFCHCCDLLSARLWFDQPEDSLVEDRR